jgi:regulatory protein
MTSSARERALYYLGRFARTERQVSDYLKRKGFESAEISETIQYLHEHRLLNDHSFAESFILSKIRHCDGPLKIKQMLFQKGISGPEVEALLKEHYPSELQVEKIAELLERRPRLDREKAMRFVASRGFSPYVIIQALRARH